MFRPLRVSRERQLSFAVVIAVAVAVLTVSSHHLDGSVTLLAGRDNLGPLCLVALHQLLSPVHEGFHFALGGGLLYALLERASTVRKSRKILGQLEGHTPVPGDPFWNAAVKVGISPMRLSIVKCLPNPAFTFGWFKPKIFLSSRLPEILSPSELCALLRHEQAHMDRKDPMRLAVLKFVACFFFWIPVLASLMKDLAEEVEFSADRIAARVDPLVLASAILNMALVSSNGRALRVAGSVGFADPDLVECRVRRLAGEPGARASHLSWKVVVWTLAIVAVSAGSGALMAHPLDAKVPPSVSQQRSHGEEKNAGPSCNHHRQAAILHLFCPGFHSVITNVECAHSSHRV